MTDYIKLGFSLLLLVFIFFGFLWGIIRGLKKTISRGIFLLVISIVLIFVAVPITNAVLKINISCNIVNAQFELVGKYDVIEILTEVFKAYIGPDFMTQFPDFAQAIVSFGIILVNSIVYLVLFWVLKYLLLPLNVIVTKIMFPPKRQKAEVVGFAANADESTAQPLDNNDTQIVANNEATTPAKSIKVKSPKKEKMPKIKEKKKRMLGGLVGIVVGLIVTFNTMIPIYGIFDILDTAKELKLENLTDEPTDLSTLTDGMIDEISNGYKESVMKLVSQYTGLEAAGLVGFDKITTVKIGEDKISLRSEIDAIFETIKQADVLIGKYNEYSKDSFKNTTQAQLDDLLTETKTLVNKCEGIKLINCLSEYLIPMGCSIMINSNMQLTSVSTVDAMITDTLRSLVQLDSLNILDEVYRLLDIASYTNKQGLLLKVLKNDMSDPIGMLEGLDDNFASTLLSKIFALKTVDTTLPNIFNIGLTYFDELTKFGYSQSTITNETLKTKLSTLADDAFKLFLSMDMNSPAMISFDSITPLGKLLSTVKTSGLINAETYTNLMSYTTTKLKEIANGIVPEEFTDVFNNQIINNMNLVVDWEAEMNHISRAIDQLRVIDGGIIGEVIEGQALRVGNGVKFTMDETTINNLGIALDYLEASVLFGAPLTQQVYENGEYYAGTTVTKLLASFCDSAIEMVGGEDSSITGFTEVITSIKTNIISAGHSYNAQNPNFYENEFKEISPLLVELNNILSGGEVELSTELGIKLDKAKASVMFGGKTTLILIRESMKMVKDGILGDDFSYDSNPSTQDTNDKIYELFDDIQDELDSIAVLNQSKQDSEFWQHEIDSYLALKNIAEATDSISTTEDILPFGEDLDIAYSCYTIPKAGLNSVIAFTIRQLKTNVTTGIEGEINNMIDDIATNVEAESFDNPLKDYTNYWQIELNHIHSLNTLDFEEKEDIPATPEDESFGYDDIGFALDKVTLGYTTEGTSTTLGYDSTKVDSTRASYLITHNMVRSLLGAGIEEMKTSILESFTDTTINTAVSTALTGIKNNITNTTSIPTISFHKEMGNLGKLAHLDVSANIFDNPTKLHTLGETLDEIAYVQKSSGTTTTLIEYDNNASSKVITRPIISQMVMNILPIAKSGEATPTATDTTIDGIATNIDNLKNSDAVMSWARELDLVSLVMELKDTTISDATYQRIGEILDEIAFNKVGTSYAFNDIEFEANGTIQTTQPTSLETANSLLITRQMLNANISHIIRDMATSESNDTIQTTLYSIATSIDNNTNRIYSWTKEIDMVNQLKNLNSTEIYSSDVSLPEGTIVEEDGTITLPTGSTYQLSDNSLNKLANNIDAIAFNHDAVGYDDTMFDAHNIVTNEGQNSLIITRTILRDMVASFLNNAKPTTDTDEDLITIKIINNATGKINVDNVLLPVQKFSTFEESFTELITIKTLFDNLAEQFTDLDISDIKLNDDGDANEEQSFSASEIDSTLQYLSEIRITDQDTTKMIAKLILGKLNGYMINLYSSAGVSFTNTDIGKYISYLLTFYDNPSNTTILYKTNAVDFPLKDGEDYITTNPFATIVSNYVSALS